MSQSPRETLAKFGKLLWPAAAAALIIVGIVTQGDAGSKLQTPPTLVCQEQGKRPHRPKRITDPRRPSFWRQGYWNLRREMDATAWATMALTFILTAVVGATMPMVAGEEPGFSTLTPHLVAMWVVLPVLPVVIVFGSITIGALSKNETYRYGWLLLWVRVGPPNVVKITFGSLAVLLGLGILWSRAWQFFGDTSNPYELAVPTLMVEFIGFLAVFPIIAGVMSLRRVALGMHALNVNRWRSYGYSISGKRRLNRCATTPWRWPGSQARR